MPKIDLRTINRENECPHCGSDEMWFNKDGLLECDWCGKLPTDDVEYQYEPQRKIIKKMKKYE